MKKTIFLVLTITIAIIIMKQTFAIIIFNDTFESGSLTSWTLSTPTGANNWTANQTNPFQGSWHAQSQPRSTSQPASVLERAIPTSNYQNISIFYYRRLVGIDAADEFQMEWFNGTTWTILESTGGASANDASYLYREFNLSIQANNNPSFQIKFECTAGATSEYCRVDNVTITGNLIQDVISPIVNLIAPINNTITASVAHSFNATFLDNIALANATYYLWNSTNSLINTTSRTLSGLADSINLTVILPYEGKFTWNYLTADTSNNMAFNLTNFTILYDATPPSINYVSPTQQSGIIKNSNFIEINITASDLYIQALTISLFNSTKDQIQINTSNTSPFYINYSNFQDGLYFYNASSNDTANNIANLETRNITIDTTPPSITSLTESPSDPTTYLQNAIYQFNATITDITQIQSVKLEFNGTNYTATNLVGNIYNVSISNLPAGTFNYIWFANDSAGNSNTTQTQTYTINKAAGNITLSINNTDANQTAVFQTQTNASASTQFGTTTLLKDGVDITSQNHLFTTLGVGDYNYTALSTGDQNHYSAAITRFVHITKASSEVNLTLNETEGNITIAQGTIIPINATKITGDSLAILKLYNNGTLINQGQSQLSNLTNFTIPGLYNITIIYTSTQNYTESSETYYVNVVSPQDIIPPYFTIIPQNTTINYTQGFQVNFEAGDNIALDSLSINWTTNFEINKTGSLKNTTKLAAGTYLINVTINDTSNNKNSTIYQITVNKIQSQVNTFLNHSRSNITIQQNTQIYLNSTLIVGEGTIKLYNNNSLINQAPSQLSNLTNFTILGTYNITTIHEETQNYTSSSETFYIDIIPIPDTTFPLISIIQPQNISYNTNSLQINFTVLDTNLQSCWYTTNSGQTNTTLTNCQNTSYTAAQGSTTLNLYANDSSNNINSSTVTFFVDSINPLISYTPPTESNNSLIKTKNIVINISAADTNLANITIFLLNSTSLVNQTTTTSNNNFINITNLPDGIYYFNATAIDILNNKNSTETRTIILDSTSPQITSIIENPANGSSYALNAKYEFNATITDNTAISSVIIEFNGINYTLTNLTSSLFNFTISNLAAGDYNYYFRANDTTGNTNISAIKTFTISKAQGSISLLLNNTASNITLSYPSQINASATSSTNQIIQLLKNNVDITSQNHLFQNLQSNLYNFTAIAQENQNYTQAIITRFADLQKGIPQGIISLSPSNSIIYGTQTTISVSESNQGDADISYTLARNNIITTNPETLILGAGIYNYTFNATEGQNWTSTILDTKLLTINKSSSKVYTYINNSRSNITLQLGNTLQINSTLINGTFGSLNLTQNSIQLNFSTSNNLTYTQIFNTIGNFLINSLYQENENFSLDSESWFVTVTDSFYPQISIIQPQNTSYNNPPMQLNYSISDTNLQSCWYTTNSGQTNTSITCGNNISIISEQGSNTWILYSNDSAGNTNSSSVTFFVDSIIPLISFIAPTESNNSIKSQNFIFINVSITETNLANITFSLHNSTSLVNQTTFTTQIPSINFTSLQDGIYFYNVTIKDTLNNQNTTETRTITLDTIPPSISIISPQNITYFNISILINISSNGNTIWFFNTTANETYISPVYRILDGSNTIIAYANDSAGNINLTSITFYATEIKLNCEVGGPYQQGALILIQGNLSNKTSPLNSQQINVTIYKNNLINLSKILTTSNDGSFETSITNLSIGNYILNATTFYLQSNHSCTDNFQIGSQASLIINKIASIHNITNETIYYNITLKLANNGGADSLNTNITDSDSGSSPYLIGTLSPSSSYQTSYLKNFTRQSSTTYYLTSIATALGIDSYSNSLLATNSTQINLTIPPTQVGKQLVITKNILYISENSLNITYNITSTIFNSGDEDLTNINYIDTDISSIAIQLNLTKSSSQTLSNTKTIAKAASNTQHEFALGTATISSLNFYSNRPKINIPGYGGPADVIVYAPSSLNPSASFDSIIEIKNVNPDIGQDFPIAYWITSNEETQNYSSGQKTIYVGANSSVNTTITLTSPATARIYKLKAQATWAGGSASAFDSFEVISTSITEEETDNIGKKIKPITPDLEKNKTIEEKEEKTPEKQKEIICNPPYIIHNLNCCLDKNNNNICDDDEKETPKPKSLPNLFNRITGFITNHPNETKIIIIYSFSIILLIIAIILIIISFILIIKKPAKKDTSRLKNVIGLKVYTSEGIEIGKVKDIFLENYKIHSIQIKLKKKKKFKLRGITISYKYVKALKDIIIVNKEILEKINKK